MPPRRNYTDFVTVSLKNPQGLGFRGLEREGFRV